MSECVFRCGDDNRLSGVLALPVEPVDAQTPVVVLLTAGLLHKPGPYRLYVDLARQLAAAGIPALRFDLGGIGESSAALACDSAEVAAVNDARAAMDALTTALGTRRFVLAGLCSGAELAHRVAIADARVAGVIALDGFIVRTPLYYLHHYLPRLLSLAKWRDVLAKRWRRARVRRQRSAPDELEPLAFWASMNPSRDQLAAQYRSLVERKVKQLLVFSGGSGYCSYERQFLHAFRDVDFRDTVTVRYFRDADHMYVLQQDRRELLRLVTAWVTRHFGQRHALPAAEQACGLRAPSPAASVAAMSNLLSRHHLSAQAATRRTSE